MNMPVRNIIADLEYSLTEALTMSDHYHRKFKEWEETVIKLRESIETLRSLLNED